MLSFAVLMAIVMSAEGLSPSAAVILACQLCCGVTAGVVTAGMQLSAENTAVTPGWGRSAVFTLLGSMLSAVGTAGSWTAAFLVGAGVDTRAVVGTLAVVILCGAAAVARRDSRLPDGLPVPAGLPASVEATATR